jgi:hypothetical protein
MVVTNEELGFLESELQIDLAKKSSALALSYLDAWGNSKLVQVSVGFHGFLMPHCST